MKLHLVMSLGTTFQQKGWDRGRWVVHLKGTDSMAVCGFSFRNTLVGSGWGERLLAESRNYCKLINGMGVVRVTNM